MSLDAKDRHILRALQRDARLSNQELAKKVDLSPSPCWRRVRQLEQSGIIKAYVSLLDPAQVGLAVLAYAHVSLKDHHPGTVETFVAVVQESPQVLECCAMSGAYDYLLKVRTRSMEGYEDFLHNQLLAGANVRSVSTSFVMSQKKYTTALPLD